MLTVDHYELIRRRVLIEGLSQRVAAQALGHSRKTVAKARVISASVHEVGFFWWYCQLWPGHFA